MKPTLSVVTPTRGNFSQFWLTSLLAIQGDVQFVVVYPPDSPPSPIDDCRVKAITSPYKGEMMQRFVGLLNADGRYVIALDDDDYLHPDVVALTTAYFERFPDSLVLRLYQERIPAHHQAGIEAPWPTIPDVSQLPVLQHFSDHTPGLLEIPIAPLDIPFDRRYVFWPFVNRQDDQGRHIENFNTKVWDNDKVKQVLPDLAKTTELIGITTWIPRSGFDRLMGLFVQAYWFKSKSIVGHWLPSPGQVRFITVDAKLKPPRFHAASDLLLVKRFPQYGYFWNLFFHKLSYVPRLAVKLAMLNMGALKKPI
jgi:glycosyltransferase involved in cell wall biosynthesis